VHCRRAVMAVAAAHARLLEEIVQGLKLVGVLDAVQHHLRWKWFGGG
jgi:hypothetical protein